MAGISMCPQNRSHDAWCGTIIEVEATIKENFWLLPDIHNVTENYEMRTMAGRRGIFTRRSDGVWRGLGWWWNENWLIIHTLPSNPKSEDTFFQDTEEE